ncbi:MAG: hypothetical protein LM590_06505 [Thermofilum sp.]|nr:hypothetical protein [Thermofilum sp.]
MKSVEDALRKGLEAVFLEDYFQPTQLEKLHQPPLRRYLQQLRWKPH